MKKNILVLTAIKPDKDNRGGPSGLIWECIYVLRESGLCDLEIIVTSVNNKFNKLGIYYNYIDKNMEQFDSIFVYPFNLFFYLKPMDRNKAYVLGPDAPSLLFARFHKNSDNFKNKFRNFLLKHWFIHQEKELLNSCKKYFVVGNNDSRWLKNINFDKKLKIKYLTHPILKSIIEDNYISDDPLLNRKALVFAGDMSEKYTGIHIKNIGLLLHKIDLPIIIVGKNNKWVYEYFSTFNKNDIVYLEWIENYNSICNPKYHIHVIPLINGAGTKNRTLTACAKGITIISTSIGVENIFYNNPLNNIHKFVNSSEIIFILKVIMKEENKSIVLLDKYIEKVNEQFKINLIQNLVKDML